MRYPSARINTEGGYRTLSFGICKNKSLYKHNLVIIIKYVSSSCNYNGVQKKCNAYCEFKWTPTKPNNVLLQGHCSEVEIV